MKKFLIAGLVIVVVVIAAAAVLVKNSNRLIKEKIETALGKNVSVQELSLSWGAVDVIGVKVMQDNVVIAKADRIGVKADVLGFLKQGYALSSLTIEKPFIRMRIDRNGNYVNPFAAAEGGEKREDKPSETKGFSIGTISIRDGEFALQDDRKIPAMNTIAAKKLNLELNDFAYPLRDTASRIDFSGVLEGRLIAGSVKAKGDVNLKTKALQLQCDGQQIGILDFRDKGAAAKAESVQVRIASDKARPGLYTFSEFSLVRPYLRVERDRNGEYVNPFASVEAAAPSPAAKAVPNKEKADDTALFFQKIQVSEGVIDYYNGMVSAPPHLTRLDAVALQMDNVSIPSGDASSNFTFSSRIRSGTVASKGVTTLKSKDTNATVTVRNLDVTRFKPYFQKKGDADITRGTMDLDMDLKIKSRMIDAPGTVVLKDLDFGSGSGVGATFVGVPRNLVLSALKTGNNAIALDIRLEGNLDDPKFSVREGLMKRLTAGLAGKLGVGVAEIGGAVVGAGKQGVEQVGKGAQGIGEGIRKLFKK
ncbi:MAG TPA: DUF748 domain-containing protein [Dissulfurispiraceae bacterium]|nr:DUF748 domain-containing protein [Dissulfurispiraceae bacterium]